MKCTAPIDVKEKGMGRVDKGLGGLTMIYVDGPPSGV